MCYRGIIDKIENDDVHSLFTKYHPSSIRPVAPKAKHLDCCPILGARYNKFWNRNWSIL